MKKLFIAALLAVSVVTSVYADGPSDVNATILYNFRSNFTDATNVTWVSKKDYVKAVFTLDNSTVEAFYKLTGELIGTSKNISLEELPISAKRTFARKFYDYTVVEAIRFEGTDETAYYISAVNDKQSVILKVDGTNQLTMFKKTKL